MGRWKDGHNYIRTITIITEDGRPALIYNLDHKGRIVYEYPVCLALPAHVKYENPGTYTFVPPPVQAYKKSLKEKDPSISGHNSITVNINNPILDQKNTNSSFKIINPNLQNNEELQSNKVSQYSATSISAAPIMPSVLPTDISSLSLYDNFFDSSMFSNSNNNQNGIPSLSEKHDCKSKYDQDSTKNSLLNNELIDTENDIFDFLFSTDSDEI